MKSNMCNYCKNDRTDKLHTHIKEINEYGDYEWVCYCPDCYLKKSGKPYYGKEKIIDYA